MNINLLSSQMHTKSERERWGEACLGCLVMLEMTDLILLQIEYWKFFFFSFPYDLPLHTRRFIKSNKVSRAQDYYSTLLARRRWLNCVDADCAIDFIFSLSLSRSHCTRRMTDAWLNTVSRHRHTAGHGKPAKGPEKYFEFYKFS